MIHTELIKEIIPLLIPYKVIVSMLGNVNTSNISTVLSLYLLQKSSLMAYTNAESCARTAIFINCDHYDHGTYLRIFGNGFVGI